MLTTQECRSMAQLIPSYIEGALPQDDRLDLEDHLRSCHGCRERVKCFGDVQGVLKGTYGSVALNPEFEAETKARLRSVKPKETYTDFDEDYEDEEERVAAVPVGLLDQLQAHFGAAPWWMISGTFHALLLLLITLITMAIVNKEEESVVIVTDLEEKKEPEEIKEPLKRKIFEKPVPIETEEISETMPVVTHEEVEISDMVETADDSDAAEAQGEDGISDVMLGGSGNVAALGLGGGGGGAFGRPGGAGGRLRRATQGGGGKATESAVDAALAWLARHQEPGGYWDVEKYRDNKSARYGFKAQDTINYNIGVSGLATLAFLGAGHSLKVGKYKKNVQAGIKYLLSQQGADGDFTSKVRPCSSNVVIYCHSIATLACAEALAMNGGMRGEANSFNEAAGKARDLGGAVAKGVELILKWQDLNQHGGWSYSFGGGGLKGPLDPTATGWAVMALKSAKVAGLKFPMEHFSRASDGLKKLTSVDNTKGDYGLAIAGYRRLGAKSFNSKGYACTAAMSVTQLFLGMDPMSPTVAGGVNTITQQDALPAYIFQANDSKSDHQNYYYWYYGTLACFQNGGDAWQKWNVKMKAALVPNQRKGGAKDGSPQDVDGSWDPNAVWAAWAGRAYSTAMGALSLEVYYRYLPMYR